MIVLKKNTLIHLSLLLLSIILGTIVRFTHLDSKPPWADEWATLVFSLGNSFLTVPLDKIITVDHLLQPLLLDSTTNIGDVISNLLGESTHPPVYFVLNHLWLRLFSPSGELVSIAVARSLSAGLGVVAIPAMFGLGFLVCGSLVAGQMAAWLMALSPYGVYLAQETRHYTLVILLVIGSLSCLIVAIKNLRNQNKTPLFLIFLWILINSLGVATHYFFALTLVTETLVLLSFFLKDFFSQSSEQTNIAQWRRIIFAIAGTIAGCLVWVWTWLNIPDNQLTDWTSHGNPWGNEFFEPIGRIAAWIGTMLVLLPIEGTPATITIVSAVILLLFLLWLLVTIFQYLKNLTDPAVTDIVKGVIGKYVLFAIILILVFVYVGDRDLTLAARFHFFYFPGILIFIVAVFQYIWNKNHFYKKLLVISTLFLGLTGSWSVVYNYAYQKPDRSDLVITKIIAAQKLSPQIDTLIATVHKTHEQTGEMMGIAWEWNKIKHKSVANKTEKIGERKDNKSPLFLLLHKPENSNQNLVANKLYRNLNLLPRPLDVWMVNFSASTNLETQNCLQDANFKFKVAGYQQRLYHCN